MKDNATFQEAKKYFDFAQKYIEIHWFDEAVRAILQSLRLLQSDACSFNVDLNEHYYTLAWVYNQKKDYKNAILYLNLIDFSSNVFNEAKILKCIIELNKGDLILAKGKLQALLKENESNSNIIEALSEIYLKLKMYKKARELYEKGLQIYPCSYTFLSGVVQACLGENKLDEALLYNKKLYELYPNGVEAQMFFAKIHYLKNEFDTSLNNLNQAIELDINNDEAHYFKALILNKLRKSNEALEELKIALNLCPSNALYYAEIAKSYELLGDFQSALLYIKEAIDISFDDVLFIEAAKFYCEKLNDKKGEKFYSNRLKTLKQ